MFEGCSAIKDTEDEKNAANFFVEFTKTIGCSEYSFNSALKNSTSFLVLLLLLGFAFHNALLVLFL